MTETDSRPTLLAIFAHPDDEAFGCGGALARHAAAGHRVVLVCATRGELGEISDPALATPETLGEVREQELRCAAAALGISELIFLDYRDSGMAGTEGNTDPRAFAAQPADAVVRKLVEVIRRERPGAILTFEPGGGYGHPDHIAAHHHTMAALSAAGTTTYARELGAPWRTPLTWWSVLPRSAFRALRDAMSSAGLDTTWADELIETSAGWPDDEVDLMLDIAAWTDDKWRASECHATQFGENNLIRQARESLGPGLMTHEAFVLAADSRRKDAPPADLLPS
ncbi:MAG TPA: PIG-L family deacetylase [Thermomicrobiales bacterium]|jgi:LmbE family N-acetylglucosaminyl deacetylase|nr:hypothetical protein [Chloroflexota bacterium]HQX62331.1 PIG-L family deacetylase [Thermomicrobiales bacterium]HQZ90040.1 PIG-L family deacetylase [Thermomicrobiales bacterium]HRA32467.1 PIG-L family deacetylase [Thermomicrobiales bacterium]